MTSYIIPCLLAFVVLFALGRKTDVYNALVQGAENGLNITFHCAALSCHGNHRHSL